MQRAAKLIVLVLAVLLLSTCSGGTERAPQGHQLAELAVTSSAFAEGGSIPVQHTCDGQDVSPPLAWTEPPVGTQSFALIVDDPDAPAGTWVHWLLYRIPATSRSLPQDVPGGDVVVDVGVQGSNGWRRLGYGGPCPPKGSNHRYLFSLYALDLVLELESGASERELGKAMAGHVLAQGVLVGRYER